MMKYETVFSAADIRETYFKNLPKAILAGKESVDLLTRSARSYRSLTDMVIHVLNDADLDRSEKLEDITAIVTAFVDQGVQELESIR